MGCNTIGNVSITISLPDSDKKMVFESPTVEEFEIENDRLRIYLDPKLKAADVQEYDVSQIDHLATSVGDSDGIHWSGYLHRNIDGDTHLPDGEAKRDGDY